MSCRLATSASSRLQATRCSSCRASSSQCRKTATRRCRSSVASSRHRALWIARWIAGGDTGDRSCDRPRSAVLRGLSGSRPVEEKTLALRAPGYYAW
jgi:hypothetical protein